MRDGGLKTWKHLLCGVGVVLAFGATSALTPAQACTNPTAVEGEIIYNSHFKTMLFCNGTDWIDMGSGGSVKGSLTGEGKFVDGFNANDAVYTSGSVGIGVSAPASPLEVLGSATTGETLRLNPAATATDEGAQITLMDAAGSGAWEIENKGAAGAEDFVIVRDKAGEDTLADALVIKTDGDIGIGTATPTSKLQITGVTTTESLIIGGVNGQPAPVGGGTNSRTNSLVDGWPDILKCRDTFLEISEFAASGGTKTTYYQVNNGTYGAQFDNATKTHDATFGWPDLGSCDGLTVQQLYNGGFAYNLVNTNSTNGTAGQFAPGTPIGSAAYVGGQVGVGTVNPHASAVMEVSSTTGGFLPPRMSETQRDAISSPATGVIVFNTDETQFEFYDGSEWTSLGGGAKPDPFDFTDLTDQGTNLQVTSNSVTVTGLNQPAQVSVAGDGNPEVRINGGSWVTAGAIVNNQTLEVRMTTATTQSTASTVTLFVGSEIIDWSVTTEVQLYAFTSHQFNNCGQSGRNGPTLSHCTSSYNPTDGNWDTNTSYFNMTTQGYQLWTVPASGNYRIRAAGARGGYGHNSSSTSYHGRGRVIEGEITLTRGDIIIIAVGHRGGEAQSSSARGGAGGGGTFIALGADQATATILMVAGGGGGANAGSNYGWGGDYGGGRDGRTGNNGDISRNWGNYMGNGASVSARGLTHNNSQSFQYNAMPFRETLIGSYDDCYGLSGGFGGGGSPNCHNGAGGGGYTGGAGGNGTSNRGEGGGSYFINTMTNTNNNVTLNSGHGYVTITRI